MTECADKCTLLDFCPQEQVNKVLVPANEGNLTSYYCTYKMNTTTVSGHKLWYCTTYGHHIEGTGKSFTQNTHTQTHRHTQQIKQ